MAALFENLKQLITCIDELRDVGLQNYISLPQIVAIGAQSSGKSSLIESIVGRDFLPRGGGVVTRRPLELRLKHLSTQTYKADEAWAVFDKTAPEKKLTDFDAVRAEIERQTDAVAGANKAIVNDPIILTVYATDAPDLTMVDLPGITRVAIGGQTDDIEKVTRDMSMHYIKDPRAIILAVVPANQDISSSDGLQLAKMVDPQGIRTIGVITKIDIMDNGTDAAKMLRGEEIPLKHGYVGVKMRSQADITAKKAVRASLDEEKAWFESHRIYGKMSPGLLGTQVLISKLTQILFKSVRRFMPEIKSEINERRRSVQDRLAELGEGAPITETEQIQVMWTMVTDYCEMFKNTIRGKYDRRLQRYMASDHSQQSLMGGAKVRGIMNDFLADFVEVSITREMTDDDFDRAIRVHEGDALPGFPSPDTFEFLALPHLQKINMPAVECVHSVAMALDNLAQRIAHNVFRRFPQMAEAALGMTQAIISAEREATTLIVEQQVACFTGYLFTNDPDYLTSHGSMEPMVERKQPEVVEEIKAPSATEKAMNNLKDGTSTMLSGARSFMSKQEQQRKQQRYSGPFVTEMRKRLDSYFAITVRSVRDSVPKAIGFYLVRAVQDKLQYELLQALNQKDKLSALLGEPAEIREERKTLASQLQVLQKASGVLTRDPALAAMVFEAEDEEEERRPVPQARTVRSTGPGLTSVGPTGLSAPLAASPAASPVLGKQGGSMAASATAQKQGGSSLFGAPSKASASTLFDDKPAPVASKTAGPLSRPGLFG